ncbi:hypothetical protein KI387_032170 [Taxus chinensis]|uniref:Nucleoside phosphorylase domain-containing protein n=1 Tax=Taxus chinensis TaxID=29808 RepID=A0AA38F381_TAXCH|nr:hypothetical protein KI387_032170 [Taxus chinensis]
MAFQRRSIPSAFLLLLLMVLTAFPFPSRADIPKEVAQQIKSINKKGEYYGLIVSGNAELKALIGNGGVFQPDGDLPTVDASARRYHVGKIGKHRTIVVMCGSGMVNAAQTAQFLVSLFRVRAVLHYGRAASANPNKLHIGDVAIPRQFAHAGIFYWEKYQGDSSSFTRDIANLTFSEYNVGEKKVANKLQSVYFQPEVIYYAGKAENGKETFFINVDDSLYALAQKIENVELDKCVAKSLRCLEQQPKIKRIEKGSSANIYVNNEAYRDFLRTNLDITSIDTESAAIAMVCKSEKNMAFLALRSITNYAGGSVGENDVDAIQVLWGTHALSAVREMFKRLPSLDPKIRSVTDT